MRTVSHFRPFAVTLNKPVDCNVLCGMITKYIEEYFQYNPNDGNNCLKLDIVRIGDASTESFIPKIEYKN